MDLGLAETVAVVTGGANGIGRAIASGFCSEQAAVAVWDLAESVEDVAAELQSKTDARVIGCRVDITNQEQLEAARDETERQLGPIRHLVHAAAIGSGKYGFPFTNLSPDDWPRVLEVNIMGMTRVAHAIAPGMTDRRAGTMTFLASVAGQIGSQTDPPYSAAKAANINFAQCLAKDLARSGVRVNTVCPGMVKTPLNRSVWQSWFNQQPEEQKQDYEQWAQEKIDKVCPLGMWQEPADIADMVLFLASVRARQVTGQTINVDGGFVMHS